VHFTIQHFTIQSKTNEARSCCRIHARVKLIKDGIVSLYHRAIEAIMGKYWSLAIYTYAWIRIYLKSGSTGLFGSFTKLNFTVAEGYITA
jgi:hypothetical protein